MNFHSGGSSYFRGKNSLEKTPLLSNSGFKD